MNFRERMNESSSLVTVAAAVVACLVVGMLAWRAMADSDSKPTNQPQVYYYDLNRLELFHAPASSTSPLETESGPHQGEPAGVRAHVLACGQCSDASKRFIGWLEKPAPDAGETEAMLVCSPEDLKWVLDSSPAGKRLLDRAISGCNGERVNLCRPEHELRAK